MCSIVLVVGLWLPSAAAQAATTTLENLRGVRIRGARSIGSPMHRVDNTLPPARSINVSAQIQPGGAFPGSLDALNGSVEQSGENVPPLMPLGVSGDEYWSGNFALPGANNYVNAVAVYGSGTLYAGGIFTATGGIPANYVAKWNDSGGWSALGTGVNSYVDALVVDGSGNLYAGGNFTTAGGTTANHIAMWNGSSWSALGNGLNSAVLALAVDGSGNLYAGGLFTQICGNAACTSGNATASYVAMWNGSSWSAVGSGVNSSVQALRVFGGNLYAGGGFTTAGGANARSVAKWNGSSWSALGYGLDFDVFALAVDGSGNLYAGGSFTQICWNAACSTGTGANHIAKWTGTSWWSLGSLNGDVYAIALDAGGNVYVGGDFNSASVHYIARWTGGSWAGLGAGMAWDVLGLAVDATGKLYAGGYFATAGGRSVNYVASWWSNAWSELGYGMNNYVKALAMDSNGNLYAGGNFTKAGGISTSHIAKWNGNIWSALGSGMDDNVQALALDGSGNLYAGGDFITAGGTTVNHVAKWNGSAWSALGNGMDFPVYTLAVDTNGNLFAGGQFLTAGGTNANRVAMWNGSNWSAIGYGVSGFVNALAVSNGTLYVGGNFTQLCGNATCSSGNTTVNHIAKWNGNNWSALGNGVSSNVYALAADETGNVYAGGYFTAICGDVSCAIGNTAMNYIARWYSNTWYELGSGVTGVAAGVFALAVDGSGKLYASGRFATAGSQAASNVAKWSGSNWSALGSGVNIATNALAANGNKLYLGGGFTMAGGKPSSYIAQWSPSISSPSFRLYLPIVLK